MGMKVDKVPVAPRGRTLERKHAGGVVSVERQAILSA
jgi:hypothetical protein